MGNGIGVSVKKKKMKLELEMRSATGSCRFFTYVHVVAGCGIRVF